jgi:hypothetical protein
MKKILLISIALIAAFLFAYSCSNDPSSDGVDRLTLGTGLGPGKVTGNGEIFTVKDGEDGVLIYFNLESKSDIGGGKMISILIEQKIGEIWYERRLFDYGLTDNMPSYYYLGSFFHSFGIGSFRATGFMGNRRLARASYIVN